MGLTHPTYSIDHSYRRLVGRMYLGGVVGRKAYLQRQRVSSGGDMFKSRWLIYVHYSYVDQLNQILHYLGTPSEDTLRRVGSPRVNTQFLALFG